MRRFGKGQMVWVKPLRSAGPQQTKAARYDKPGLEQGTHMVRLNNGRYLTVNTGDITTKNEKNLEDTDKLLKT